MNRHHHAAVREVLTSVEALLLRERELFGEALLVDQAMPRSPHTPAPDAELFAPAAAASGPLTAEPWGAAATLDTLERMICDCLKCPLGPTRTKFVFGTGNPAATLMLVGEGPGADEDAQGEPFVGRAGQLLNKILEAINFQRNEVYICNIVKCRPPNNRRPEPEEVGACLPYLRKQIALVRPKVILCLGLTAAQSLLRSTEGLGKLRGQVLAFEGTPLMVTYHPAALLRNPNWKRPAWEDVQAVRKLHDDLVAGRNASEGSTTTHG
jgi:uracil-DNA glycosylase family 4